jgi:GTP-binding protein
MPKAVYLKSAVFPIDYPSGDRPEIAMAGRSNAGKSSLLNSMTGGASVARTSGTPGKTRLLNFFDVGDFYRLVDLPGYGYAARDATERNQWKKMIEDFLMTRENIRGLILICDVRRDWTEDEQLLYEFAKTKGFGIVCALSKCDKFSPQKLKKELKRWYDTGPQDHQFFWPVSALNNIGVAEIEKHIFKTWIKPTNAGQA